MNRTIRMALTKGRIEKGAVALLEKAGYGCQGLRDKGRRLIVPTDGGEIDVVFAKAADVITYVETGACDIGIVGKDTILENGSSFYEMADLGIGRCRMVLAAPKGSDFFSGYAARRVASKYPKIAADYFSRKQLDVGIIKIEGSVELGPVLGLTDAIVDLVETGKTLAENGLEVVETVCEVSTRLIVNIASLKLRKAEIEEIVGRLNAAKEETP
ncbi:MAG: ATP phosphoribosyltransferase [Oscillospiraceae bacterium]|nr:MAG: ATP phosphoribosyltransferase [Oscillospiraceae bacterium]